MTMWNKYEGRTSRSLFLIALVAMLGLFSCDPDEDMTDPGFDRVPMLTSVADDLIIPNFESLQASVNAVSVAVDSFVQTTSVLNLISLRNAWVEAVTDHQHTSAFGFGPAELFLGPYAEVLGAFPVSETGIEQAMLDANLDLANSFARDIRGFYAVEYLIYGNGFTDAQIVDGFNQDRKNFLQLITAELKTTIDNIVSEWKSSYRDEFIASDGTAAGSSISLYYNEFVKDYENLKNFKLELPAGLSAGQSGPDGSLVEAFYSGISRDLVVEHFTNSKNIWTGRSRAGQDIIGFEAYLATVVGGPDLVTQAREAVTRIDNAIANLPTGRLADHVASAEVETLRDELQANTANFKSSTSSLLGIDITFNSGDGD